MCERQFPAYFLAEIIVIIDFIAKVIYQTRGMRERQFLCVLPEK